MSVAAALDAAERRIAELEAANRELRQRLAATAQRALAAEAPITVTCTWQHGNDDRIAELEEQNARLLANQERLLADRDRCRCRKAKAA